MAKSTHISGQKRISWDAVSFLIPDNWELAVYKFLKKGVTHVEIEDEYAVRLEAEWVRPKKKLHMDNVLARYEHKTKELTTRADYNRPIQGLPEGWIATLHVFTETVANKKGKGLNVVKHSLVTAFRLCPDSALFCFFMIHFLPEDKENPSEIVRLVASDFRHHCDGELMPWQSYDIAFEVPRGFLLENTLFDVGAKLMIFRWKLRRFYLWHFSCADMFLKSGVVVEEWLAGYLNSSRCIRGGAFFVADSGQIVWKRRWWHFVAHRDELARWCFKYEVRYQLNTKKNQLVAWLFNYRKPADLEIIPQSLRFEKRL